MISYLDDEACIFVIEEVYLKKLRVLWYQRNKRQESIAATDEDIARTLAARDAFLEQMPRYIERKVM